MYADQCLHWKKQQLRIPKYNAKYNKCHQYNPPHNYTDTLNRSAFLWKYCKHQRQARWIQRRMPIRKVGVRSHTWSFKNVSIRHENTNTVITFPSLCTTNSKPSFKEYKHKYLLVSQPYSVSFYAPASIFVQTKQAFIVLIFSTPSPDNQ